MRPHRFVHVVDHLPLCGNWITLLLVVLISEILVATSATNILPPFLMMHMWDSYERNCSGGRGLTGFLLGLDLLGILDMDT
jgi:hypothetical protein